MKLFNNPFKTKRPAQVIAIEDAFIDSIPAEVPYTTQQALVAMNYILAGRQLHECPDSIYTDAVYSYNNNPSESWAWDNIVKMFGEPVANFIRLELVG